MHFVVLPSYSQLCCDLVVPPCETAISQRNHNCSYFWSSIMKKAQEIIFFFTQNHQLLLFEMFLFPLTQSSSPGKNHPKTCISFYFRICVLFISNGVLVCLKMRLQFGRRGDIYTNKVKVVLYRKNVRPKPEHHAGGGKAWAQFETKDVLNCGFFQEFPPNTLRFILAAISHRDFFWIKIRCLIFKLSGKFWPARGEPKPKTWKCQFFSHTKALKFIPCYALYDFVSERVGVFFRAPKNYFGQK